MDIPGPDDSSATTGGRQTASPGISDLRHPSDLVSDSENEASPELDIKASARGPSAQTSSDSRYNIEGDRRTGQRPLPDGASASNVLPPRISKPGLDGRRGHESTYTSVASDADRRTGDRRESARNDARREENEQYARDKRPHQHSSDTRRRDSRDEQGHPYARPGGEAVAQRSHRPPEEPRRSRDIREDKGPERKEDVDRRGGGAGEHKQPSSSTTRSYSAAVVNQTDHAEKRGGGDNRQHGSSTSRSYTVAVVDEPDPKYRPQRESRPPPSDAMPGGPLQGQGPPGPQRHSTPQPQSRSEGHSNQQNRSDNVERQDRRGQEVVNTPTSLYPALSGTNADVAAESEHQQAQQEHHQGSSGKGLLGKLGHMFGGGGLSAPGDCKCKEHEETIARMEATMRHQHQENQRLTFQRDQLGHRLQNADREVANLTERLRFAQNELANVHKELVDAKALSDTRGKELIGAQTFLTKADTISVSEVVGLARTVNNEIHQTAASLCDEFSPETYMDTGEELQQNRACVQNAIGPELIKLVENNPDRSAVNPLIVQIILQSLLCSHLGRGIEKWYDENRVSTEKIFVDLYDNIRQSENQAVSGRWRALTRARLRPQLDQWVKNFLNEFIMIMHVAGWTLTNRELEPTLPEKLQPIFKAAEKLRKAMGEQFTSADIEVAMPQVYMPFNDRELEDDWGDARNSKLSAQDIVGGTTGIGLKRRVAHDGSDEVIRYEIILRPKVVLLSSLKEIAEPPPPRPKRQKVTSGNGLGPSG